MRKIDLLYVHFDTKWVKGTTSKRIIWSKVESVIGVNPKVREKYKRQLARSQIRGFDHVAHYQDRLSWHQDIFKGKLPRELESRINPYDSLLKAPNKEDIREVEKCLAGYSKVHGLGVLFDAVDANNMEPKKGGEK